MHACILDLEAEVKEKDALISTLQEDLNELKKLVPPYKMSNIDPANFVEGVNNRYFPLTPGTKLVYEGESEDGKVRTEDYVTFETKQILGVTCVIVNNRVTLDGELIEETFDWYACMHARRMTGFGPWLWPLRRRPGIKWARLSGYSRFTKQRKGSDRARDKD